MPDLLSGFVGALVGGVIAAAAAVWAMRRQIVEMRQDMHAQTYLSILQRAQDIQLSPTLDFLRRDFPAPPGDDYSTSELPTQSESETYRWFNRDLPESRRVAIRSVIDFFNDLAHLMRNHYIDDHYVARLYYPSMYACATKLYPWWTRCIRHSQNQPNLYINFENLCLYILDLDRGLTEVDWPGFGEWLTGQQPRDEPEFRFIVACATALGLSRHLSEWGAG